MTAAASLVPGDPDAVAWLGREYGRYAAGACDAARALRRIDTGAWVGPAGDAFRAAIGEVPAKLDRGRSAFALASASLSGYARILRDAQADAQMTNLEAVMGPKGLISSPVVPAARAAAAGGTLALTGAARAEGCR